MKKRIAVAIVSTLLVILSLYGQCGYPGQQKTKQLEISRTLLHYSEDLSQTWRWALKA